MNDLLKSTLGLAIISAMLISPSQVHASDSDYHYTSTVPHSLVTPSLSDHALTSFKQEVPASHGTTVFGLPINEGPIDRTIRGVVAAGLIGTAVYGLMTKQISEPVSYTLLGVSAVPTLTAATGFCPIYSLLGIDYTF